MVHGVSYVGQVRLCGSSTTNNHRNDNPGQVDSIYIAKFLIDDAVVVVDFIRVCCYKSWSLYTHLLTINLGNTWCIKVKRLGLISIADTISHLA